MGGLYVFYIIFVWWSEEFLGGHGFDGPKSFLKSLLENLIVFVEERRGSVGEK